MLLLLLLLLLLMLMMMLMMMMMMLMMLMMLRLMMLMMAPTSIICQLISCQGGNGTCLHDNNNDDRDATLFGKLE